MTAERDLIRHRFAANLREARRRADLSQEELGFAAGLHRTEIGMLERGIRLPRIDTILRLAGALEVGPGELLEGIEWTPGGRLHGHFRMDSPSDAPRQSGGE